MKSSLSLRDLSGIAKRPSPLGRVARKRREGFLLPLSLRDISPKGGDMKPEAVSVPLKMGTGESYEGRER